MTIESARDEWIHRISRRAPGQLLLDVGPLHCYYGVDDLGRAVFLVLSETRSEAPKLADVVHIDHGERPDGKWTVVLTLTQSDYAEAFVGMCLEIYRRASSEPDEASALRVFDSTIEDWRRLLSLRVARRLSSTEIRGLAAELQFLRKAAVEVGVGSALDAWAGPHGAPQDFRFGGGRVFEVKATRIGGTTVHISSVEQLEVGRGDRLLLVTIDLNDIPSAVPGSFTLPDLIVDIRNAVQGDPLRTDLFEEKLALLRFDATDEYYATRNLEMGESRHYLVAGDFPRINAGDVAIGVIRVEYELLISAIGPFRVESALQLIEET